MSRNQPGNCLFRELEYDLYDAHQDLAALRPELRRQLEELRRERAAKAEAVAQLQAVLSSKAWRVTALPRALLDWVRRGKAASPAR